jgi:uncharacterized RDD family membrane protein YckC
MSDPRRDFGPVGGLVPVDPFRDVLARRVLAYLLDLVFIAIIGGVLGTALTLLTILSFGLLGVLLYILPAVGVLYGALTIGGRHSATWGMRLMSLEVRRTDGGRPDFVQALIFSLLFYATIALTSWLILLVALVTPRKRALHDLLSGLVIRRSDVPIFRG